MDRESLSALIRETLADYRYELPPPGTTVGVPWSAEKVQAYVEKLKDALVEPYLQRFELHETYEQICQGRQSVWSYADFWIVAEGNGGYVVWYDTTTGEFGLGIRGQDLETPISIGVRGDLVGAFCAM